MNWLEDLNKKAQELNIIERSEDKVKNSISHLTPNSHNTKKQKKLISKKGGVKDMITISGALDDLKKIEDEVSSTEIKAIVKIARILIKFLSTMRSNQLLTDAQKVDIQKSKESRRKTEIK